MNRPLLRAIATTAVVCLAITPVASAQVTRIVDDDGAECPEATYTTLYEAIAAASPDATIQVCPGDYYAPPGDPEPAIMIDKPLTIVGPNAGVNPCGAPREPEATLHGRIRIGADGVTLDGLRFTGDYYVLITQEQTLPNAGARILNNVIEEIRRYGIIHRPASHGDGWTIANNRIGNWVNPSGAGIMVRDAHGFEIVGNCVANPGAPESRGIILSAANATRVAGNRIEDMDAPGIEVVDWDAPLDDLVIEDNDLFRVRQGVWAGHSGDGEPNPIDGLRILRNHVEDPHFDGVTLFGGVFGDVNVEGNWIVRPEVGVRTDAMQVLPEASTRIADNRIEEPRWDGITIWEGHYGPLFISGNEILRGPMEGIHVHGIPDRLYPEVHINHNRVEDVRLPGINLANGHFGFVDISGNEVVAAQTGIQLSGTPEGTEELHVNNNWIRAVRGPAIAVWPGRVGFLHVGDNRIGQNVEALAWDAGMIDVNAGDFPFGPVFVMTNRIRIFGAGPPVYGVRTGGALRELTVQGNEFISDGVPGATGLQVLNGGPGLPPLPFDAQVRGICNEFRGFETGIRLARLDGPPGGFPPPPAEFLVEQNGFRDVGWPIDVGPPGASEPIHAPNNWWGSDDPPPDFPNVVAEPFLTYAEYDSDGDGLRNCMDPEADGDGVPNDVDACPMTGPDMLERDLNPNQWRVALGPDGLFFETLRKGKGDGGPSFTLTDTGGCSCFQVLHELDARGYFWTVSPSGEPVYDGYDGHLKKGCSAEVLQDWMYELEHGELPPTEAPPAGKTSGVSESWTLEAAYPNPFNPVTTLSFDVPINARVQVAVFDVLGRRMRTLVDGAVAAGRHRVTFDAADLPSGIYLVRFAHQEGVQTRVVQLVK